VKLSNRPRAHHELTDKEDPAIPKFARDTEQPVLEIEKSGISPGTGHCRKGRQTFTLHYFRSQFPDKAEG
jgi:hypothetical protein